MPDTANQRTFHSKICLHLYLTKSLDAPLPLQVERDARDLARAYRELDKTICKNEDPRCDTWAAKGECVSNSNWMIKHCGKACRHCLPPSSQVSDCRKIREHHVAGSKLELVLLDALMKYHVSALLRLNHVGACRWPDPARDEIRQGMCVF